MNSKKKVDITVENTETNKNLIEEKLAIENQDTKEDIEKKSQEKSRNDDKTSESTETSQILDPTIDTKTTQKYLNYDKLREELGKIDVNKIKVKDRTMGELPKETCYTITNNLAKKKKISYELAFALITGLAQNGGTNIKGSSIRFELGNNSLSTNELMDVIVNTMEKNKKCTIRQFCRTMANDIADIALIMNIEGDLAKKMRKEIPNISEEEAIWCSNFQTQNPRCPDKTRKWLVDNYLKRFKN